eukprot:gene3600-7161_t
MNTKIEKRKQIFVLTSAGKPVFTNVGDEQNMVTTFGLMQAIISIVQDSGDVIHSIKAGKNRIVYFLKDSLYFISVSSTGESELILRKQLDFIYNQIVLVLTQKIHHVLRTNPSKDVRDLIGADTSKLMLTATPTDICPPCIAFHAINGCVLEDSFRSEFLANLKWCLEQAEAALGLLLLDDKLLAYALDDSGHLTPDTADILLLTHLVAKSPSLHSYAPSWIPVCLPGFNPSGYLQAYVSAIPLSLSLSQSMSLSLSVSGTTATTTTTPAGDLADFVSGAYINWTGRGPVPAPPRRTDVTTGVWSHCTPMTALHYFVRFRPSPSSSSSSSTLPVRGSKVPVQCHWTPFSFPLDCVDSQQRVWSEYGRLAVCLRFGSSAAGITLIRLKDKEKDKDKIQTKKKSPSTTRDKESDVLDSAATAVQTTMASNPLPEIRSAYSVTDSAMVVVAVATDVLELFATYPATVRSVTACELASTLANTLETNAHNLFQVML